MTGTAVLRRKKTLYATALAASAILPATMAFAQGQAPAFEEMVAAGELPPLEERLPANPLVVEPVNEVGQYGGTWRSGLLGGGDVAWIGRTIAYDGLVRYDREWEEVIPNLAESWSANDDATEWTFTLREGLKWSDGEPFTAEDIEFAFNLIQRDDYPAFQPFVTDPTNPSTVEVVDEQTVIFRFEKPKGLLLDELASIDGFTIASLPKHYCSQFHPDYNENAEAEAEEAGFDSWTFWMEEKCAWGLETQRWGNPDLPMMIGWVVSEPLTANASRVVFERNPYYWKVDTEGNQLPYIDTVSMRVSESAEELTLMALNGEIDFTDRHIATVVNRPLFFDGQEDGDYRLGSNVPSNSNTLVFQLNMNHVDEAKRELYQNRDFRIGLSHAIDRQIIIDAVFTGQGEPYQPSPRPESQFFDEEMSKQYTEFNQELAIEHLEAAGLTETNAQGIRLMPDGRPAVITVDVITAFRPEWIDMLELMQLQLAEVGIELEINTMDRTLFYDKRPEGAYDAQVWQGDGGLDVIQSPRYYFPSGGESVWAFRWQAWYNGTDPDIAEEPIDWVREQMDLYSEVKAEPDPARQAELMGELLEITEENFPVIGVSLPPNGYYIAKNDLMNVTDQMKHAWLFPTPAPYDPQQWYFSDAE